MARKNDNRTTCSYLTITAEDLERKAIYFLHDITNAPDLKRIQRCVLFYIICFFCHPGRENLYEIQVNTFDIGTDPDGHQFIYQAIDELDKNHRENDTDQANQGCTYEQTGKQISLLFFQMDNVQLQVYAATEKVCRSKTLLS